MCDINDRIYDALDEHVEGLAAELYITDIRSNLGDPAMVGEWYLEKDLIKYNAIYWGLQVSRICGNDERFSADSLAYTDSVDGFMAVFNTRVLPYLVSDSMNCCAVIAPPTVNGNV